MPETKLNKTNFTIRFRRGTYATLPNGILRFAFEGEPLYATDTKQLFIGSSEYGINPVQTLDMAVTDNDELVSNNDEIVYNV